ncbi:hypothetical protein HMPREF1207_02317 [Paenibacillus sp. HGH0039]|nr:hypothetical protein HMPREF1207_02317 [Paenibacillus sp. HGH0039]
MTKRNLIIFLCFLIFVSLQARFLNLIYTNPYLGIYLKENSEKKWSVDSFDPLGVGKYYDLKNGDVIQQINGKDSMDHTEFRLWRNIEKANALTVARGSEVIDIHFDQKVNIQIHDLIALFFEMVCFSLAGFIYRKGNSNNQEMSAKYLALVFFAIGATFMALGASNRGDISAKILISTFIVLIPCFFLHFLVFFFKQKRINIPSECALRFWYSIIIFCTLIRMLYFIDPLAYDVYIWFNLIVIPCFLCCLFNNFWLLHQVNKKVKRNRELNSLLKTIWYSLFISFAPFALLSFLPALIIQRELVHSFYTSWFVFIFPVSFAYLILSKKLYDLDLYMRRILFSATISIVPSVITISCITFIFHRHISWIEITYIFTVILFIFSIFAYSMEYFTTKLEKFMFPRKYFLQQSLKKISKALGTITNFNALKEIILNDIVNTLDIHGGAIVFVEKEGIQVITAGDIDEEDVKTSMENGVYKGDKYTAFEINRHEEYRSFLVVTGKKSNTHLGQEDRHWINLIVTYLSASLENVYLIRKLTLKMYELMANIPNEEATPEFVWLRKTMYDIQEKERIRIAMDLHDTTMQDLFLLKRRLYPILQRFPKMTDEYGQLTGILTHIDLINENLRQSCFELNPYVLQKTGLVGSIRKLVDVESSYSEFQVNFIADCTAQIELLEVERKKHLFRVIQELLNNAKKHSQAEHVTIRLVEENSSISLLYEDDGIGFDRQVKEMNRKNRIISGAGIGLDQMQGRVLLMNGEFYMDTERGKGVQIEIRIPFLEGISA